MVAGLQYRRLTHPTAYRRLGSLTEVFSERPRHHSDPRTMQASSGPSISLEIGISCTEKWTRGWNPDLLLHCVYCVDFGCCPSITLWVSQQGLPLSQPLHHPAGQAPITEGFWFLELSAFPRMPLNFSFLELLLFSSVVVRGTATLVATKRLPPWLLRCFCSPASGTRWHEQPERGLCRLWRRKWRLRAMGALQTEMAAFTGRLKSPRLRR